MSTTKASDVKLRPRFSIVIPCYNEALYIGETLDSLKNQNFTGTYEVIVVDNNCSDQTVSIARKMGAHVVREPNSGVCMARQKGTESAAGEIIISTDADTVFSPNWLSNIDASFKNNKHCVAVTGPCRYRNGPWWGTLYPRLLFGAVSLKCFLSGSPFYITATNTAFRKSAWDGYNTSLTQGGDELDLLHQLRKKGKVIFNNSNPTFTSARRLSRGLFYNVFVTFFVYYLFAYYLNKLFKRTILGSAPAYRDSKLTSHFKLTYTFVYTIVFLVIILASSFMRRHLMELTYDTIDALKSGVTKLL